MVFAIMFMVCWAVVCGGFCVGQTTAPATAPTVFAEIDAPVLVLPGPQHLQALRQRLASHPQVAEVFRRDVLALADEALQREPRPLSQIHYEGRVGSDPRRQQSIEHLRDMPRLTALVWAYHMTEDPRYGDAAVRWTMAWVEALPPSGNDVNDNKLDALLLATLLLKDRMDSAQRQACLAWAADLAQKQADGIGRSIANRRAKRIKLVAAAGHVIDDPARIDWAATQFQEYVASQLLPDGGSVDLRNRDAMSYHVSGLKNMLETALILKQAGVDLYTWEAPSGASVRRSVELVNPYARGEQVHPEWVNTRVELDRRRWAAGDPKYRPGKAWDPAGSLDMYTLACAFDPALEPIAQLVRQKAASPLSWTDVVIDAR